MSDEEQLTQKYGTGEVELVDVPWDVACTYSNAIDLFGDLGHGNRIGQSAQFLGPDVQEDEHDEGDLDGLIYCVGRIVGDAYGRVVIEFDGGWLGWLTPQEFRLVDVVEPEVNYIH